MTTPTTKQLAEEMARECAREIFPDSENDQMVAMSRSDVVSIILSKCNLEQLLADKEMLEWILEGPTRLNGCSPNRAAILAAMNTKEGEK